MSFSKVAILIPVNYVIFVHRSTFKKDSKRRLGGFEISVLRETEALGEMAMPDDLIDDQEQSF